MSVRPLCPFFTLWRLVYREDINHGTLRSLSRQYNEQVNTMISTKENIKKILPQMDMVLNCVKWPKGRTDYLIDRDMLKLMEKGSVIVDISNDDQGAIESFHETTHENPRYVEEGIVHFCVSNIPGAIANSTSVAYAASVLPHFRSIFKQRRGRGLRPRRLPAPQPYHL